RRPPRAPAAGRRRRRGGAVRRDARARPHGGVRLLRREPRLLPPLFRLGRVLGGPPAAPEPPLPPAHRPARGVDRERPPPGRAEEPRPRAGGHRDRRRGARPHPQAHPRKGAAPTRVRRPLPVGGAVLGPRGAPGGGLMPGPVLCAVDLTALAGGTARFAAVFARVTGSPVTLLHVRERGEAEPAAAARPAALAPIIARTGLTGATAWSDGCSGPSPRACCIGPRGPSRRCAARGTRAVRSGRSSAAPTSRIP